jgi:hypothetical protein
MKYIRHAMVLGTGIVIGATFRYWQFNEFFWIGLAGGIVFGGSVIYLRNCRLRH